MKETLNNETVYQYFPVVLEGTLNGVLTIVILIVGVFIANKVNQFIRSTEEKYDMVFSLPMRSSER